MSAADFRDLLQVAGRRHNCAKSGTAHRLQDHGSDLSPGCGNRSFYFERILLAAVPAPVRAVVSAAVTIRSADGRKFLDHRAIDLSPFLVAGDRHRAQGRPVITLVSADDLRPAKVPDFN